MYYLFIMRQVICWFTLEIGLFTLEKNPRFTAFLDSNLHTRLAIVTENLPKKFRPDPSTFYLVIVVTNKQTDRQTNAGDCIIPRESFRGDNKKLNVCIISKITSAILAVYCSSHANTTSLHTVY